MPARGTGKFPGVDMPLETRIRNQLADFGAEHKAVIEKLELSDDIQEFVA